MLDKGFKPTVIALGYFDSVHLGHQKLIKLAKEYADKHGCTLTVFTFLGNVKAKINLTDEKSVYLPREREIFIRDLGADYIYFAPITKTFLSTGKLAFLNGLNKKFNIKCYFSGQDYTFGAYGKGDAKYLTEYAKKHNQEHIIVDTYTYLGEKVSTTRVKGALACGNLSLVKKLLGRNYSISGKVVADRQVGKKLGFPTANIFCDSDKFMLKNGVYSGSVKIDGKRYSAIINYGARPTYDLKNKLIEAHIVDFNGDLYGKYITLEFVDFMREILRFESEEQLKEQLKKDLLKIKGEKYD